MHHTIKNAIGIAAAASILVGAYVFISLAQSYDETVESKKPEAFRSFTTTGEGRVTAIPDIGRFTYTVRTEGKKDISNIQQENTAKANRAIAFVKAQGVEPKDLHTTAYHIDPKYEYLPCERKPGDYRPCPEPKIIGYEVWQSVAVTVRDFARIGDLLSGVIREGANDVSELSFTIDDPNVLQQQAREQAIARAKEKARAIAVAGGFRLGRLLAIEEGFAEPYYYKDLNYAPADGRGGGGETIAPTIEPGSQEVVVNVTMKYEIE